MPRLFSDSLERTAIRSITSGDARVTAWLLPRISLEHFRLDHNREMFRRVTAVMRKSGEVPQWADLLDDLAVSEETREEMQAREAMVVPTRKMASKLVEKLERYRQVRVFFDLAKNTAEKLKADKIDLEELTDSVSDYLYRARSSADITQEMLHVGDEKVNMRFIKSLLVPKDNEFLPTGFRAFDSRNQGVPRSSAWLVAGTTSGGKSVLANTLSLYQAGIGLRISLTSLEMNKAHVTRRAMSCVSQVPLSLINKPQRLSPSQKKEILRKWLEFHKRVKRNNGRWTIITPEDDVSMEEILTLLKPYEYDNNIIDYVGLLKGMDSEDQWRKLGSAVRYASRFASSNNNVVTLLAQLDAETGRIRYSRTMQEHAALMWQWTRDEKSVESGIITIKQPKARQLESFDFHLQAQFDTMTMRDVDVDAIEKNHKKASREDSGKKKKSSSARRSSRTEEEVYQM